MIDTPKKIEGGGWRFAGSAGAVIIEIKDVSKQRNIHESN